MKNKFALFGLYLLLSAFFISAAHAECSEQSINAAYNNIKSSYKQNLKNLVTKAQEYNNLANAAKSSCQGTEFTVDSDKAFRPGVALLSVVQQDTGDNSVLNYYVTESNWENTGIDWDKAKEGKSGDCLNAIAGAQQSRNELAQLHSNTELGGIINYNKHEVDTVRACLCDETKGTQQCQTVANEANEEYKDSSKCLPVEGFIYKMEVCPLCKIFKIILDTNAMLADKAWNSLAEAFQKVVFVFLAVLLGLETLKIVALPSGGSPGAYLKSVLTIMLKIAVTYLLLGNVHYIYEYFISPVVKGGLDAAIALLSIDSSSATECYNAARESSSVEFAGGAALDNSLSKSIYGAVECFNKSAFTLPAIGQALICHGWNDSVIPDFDMWITGLVFYAFGICIWIAVCFYLIDCTVQLGIVSALVPLLIACWPFKQTQKYAITGVRLVMNIFFCFVMIGVVLIMSVKIMTFTLDGGSGNGGADLIEAINGNNTKTLSELVSLDGNRAFVLIACAVLIFKLIGHSTQIADKFARSSGSDIGSKMGGAAMSAATAVGKGAAKISGKVGGSVLKVTGATAAFDKVKNATRGLAYKGFAKAGQAVGLGRFQPQHQKGFDGKGAESAAEKKNAGDDQNGDKKNGDDQNGDKKTGGNRNDNEKTGNN